MKEARIKIILVDDHSILLDGLTALLSQDERFEMKAAFRFAEEAIDFLKEHNADILLADYSLEGMSGLDLARYTKEKHPIIKIIILSMYDEMAVIKAALKEGVDGYILKSISQEELKNALCQVMKGLPYISPEITRLLMAEMNSPKEEGALLTSRELDVLLLITQENSNREIADRLLISERTVETHRKNIFRKTKTTTLVGLMKYAFEQKFL